MTSSNAEKRLTRAQTLVKELNDKVALNTDDSRDRCLRIAKEIVGLLQAEADYQHELSSLLRLSR